jgi:Glycosyltransferase Family 4
MALSLAKLGCPVTIISIQPFASSYEANGKSLHKNLELVSVKYPFRLPYFLAGKPFPYHFVASFHPGYRLAIRKYLSAFDVYQFEHPNLADLLDTVPKERAVVYNAHNVEYDYLTSECAHPTVKAIVAKRIYGLEKKLVQRCAKVLACSNNDKRRFMELYDAPKDKIEIIPNGIQKINVAGCTEKSDSLDRFPELSTFKRRALFAGGDVAHNHTAVRFILQDLGPRLGGDCASIIKGPCGQRVKGHRAENIFVDSSGGMIDSYAGVCTVALNPVIQGGGTNLKVLDYLAHGLPVISTEFGMRGYDDLRRFVTICELSDFAEALRVDREIHADVEKALESYLWDAGALLVKNLYSSLSN